MSAHTPGWRRPPTFTTVTLTIGIVLVLLVLPLTAFAMSGLVGAWGGIGYLAFAVATAWTLRSARRQPGSWLGRQAVRRALVVGLLVVCACLVAIGALPADVASGSFVFLLVLLVLLNVALGQATLRMASAPETAVDERQEALRNRAHTIAYALLAVVVGGSVAVAWLAGPVTRSWITSALTGGGAGLALLELLFVLPGMVVAWLEPDHVPAEPGTAIGNARARLALGMLAVTIAWPLVWSLGLIVLPIRTTSWVSPTVFAGAAGRCRELMAGADVGMGIGAHIPVHGVACWDGARAQEGWGFNASDCMIGSGLMVVTTPTVCTRTTDADGTLRFTYGSTVRPSLLPFLSREVTMRVVVDRDGRVVRLP